MTDLVLQSSEFILYQTEDGRTRVEVRFEGESAWLSLSQMAELFQRDKSVISRHIKNVFDDGELSRAATVAKSATVQREGSREVTREVDCFSGGHRRPRRRDEAEHGAHELVGRVPTQAGCRWRSSS